jgi:hypothetical protein
MFCECDCHKRKLKAAIKAREARKLGKFYYYHEDCFCCFYLGFSEFEKLQKKE